LRVEADQLIISNQLTRMAQELVLVQAPPFSDFRYTGILPGDDAAACPPGIPKSVQDAFRATGTSHIIAISG
jgi:hypothetical protein